MAVTARLFGGLGNQMFQYAAGRALSQRISVPLTLETAEAKFALQPFGLDAPVTEGPARNGLFNRVAKNLPLMGRLVEAGYCYDDRFERLAGSVTLDGYFQSWRYFADCDSLIRKAFAFPQTTSTRTNELSKAIGRAKTSVSIHIRRGDYLSQKAVSYHGILPGQYYTRAVQIAASLLGDDCQFFVFSDDFNWATELFRGKDRFHIVDGTNVAAWEDMYLMSLCSSRIIANSSFSWWGAWLSTGGGPVIAPRQWFGEVTMRRLNTCDLIPPDWITI